MSLRKFKKDELIELIVEYEGEIEKLRNVRSVLKAELEVLKNTKDDETNKTKLYLKNRIEKIQDETRRLVYILELKRMCGN